MLQYLKDDSLLCDSYDLLKLLVDRKTSKERNANSIVIIINFKLG